MQPADAEGHPIRVRAVVLAVAGLLVSLAACTGGGNQAPSVIGSARSPSPTVSAAVSTAPSPPLISIVGRGDVALVGSNPALSIRPGGLPLIVYAAHSAPAEAPSECGPDWSGCRSRIVACLDPACSKSTAVVLQTTGAQAALAFGADRLPVIAFHRDKRVFVAKCRDAAYSKNTPSLVALARCCVDSPAVVAVGADGRPVLAYQDPNDLYVRVVKCGNASCSAGRTVSKLSSLVDRGGIRYLLNTISLDVPSDGRPALLIGDTTGAVRFVRCSDATCSKSTAVTVGTGPATSSSPQPWLWKEMGGL